MEPPQSIQVVSIIVLFAIAALLVIIAIIVAWRWWVLPLRLAEWQRVNSDRLSAIEKAVTDSAERAETAEQWLARADELLQNIEKNTRKS